MSFEAHQPRLRGNPAQRPQPAVVAARPSSGPGTGRRPGRPHRPPGGRRWPAPSRRPRAPSRRRAPSWGGPTSYGLMMDIGYILTEAALGTHARHQRRKKEGLEGRKMHKKGTMAGIHRRVADEVFDRLHERIVTATWPPETGVDPVEIADSLGVSRTPVQGGDPPAGCPGSGRAAALPRVVVTAVDEAAAEEVVSAAHPPRDPRCPGGGPPAAGTLTLDAHASTSTSRARGRDRGIRRATGVRRAQPGVPPHALPGRWDSPTLIRLASGELVGAGRTDAPDFDVRRGRALDDHARILAACGSGDVEEAVAATRDHILRRVRDDDAGGLPDRGGIGVGDRAVDQRMVAKRDDGGTPDRMTPQLSGLLRTVEHLDEVVPRVGHEAHGRPGAARRGSRPHAGASAERDQPLVSAPHVGAPPAEMSVALGEGRLVWSPGPP